MFLKDDMVMYSRSGVCKIKDIRMENFNGTEQQYYILTPLYENSSTVYVPVNSDKIKLKKLLSVEEVHELIQTMSDEKADWIENNQVRREHNSEIIRNGSHRELIGLIKTLYFKKQEKISQGKKFYTTDEKVMQEAENLLYREFALVLDIKQDEVLPFIMGELGVDKSSNDCAAL